MTSHQKNIKQKYSKTLCETSNTTAEIAGVRAFEQFCTPELSARRTDDHAELVKRARYHLRQSEEIRIPTSVGEVQAYIFQPEKTPIANVLVIHGWTAESAFMSTFGDFLKRRGYRAILMDLPAHGKSEGGMVSLFDCAISVLEVAEKLGPIQFALGHSIGALAVLTAGEGHYPLSRTYPFEAYTLISMPNQFVDITREFGEDHGLDSQAQKVFEAQLEVLAGRSINDFTGANLLTNTGRPALLVHSQDDSEIPFSCAENIVSEVPQAKLIPFNNLGHRAILYAPPVVRAVTTFFTEYLQVD